jgi:hypothetical protein
MNERYSLSDVLKNISEVGTAGFSLVKDFVNSHRKKKTPLILLVSLLSLQSCTD